jgi:predicted nucleic acid-binding protein
MNDVVIFDTSVLVDEVRTGRHRKRIESVDGLVRLSLVVLAELLRGVTGPAERKFLRYWPRFVRIKASNRTNCETCILMC